MPTPVFRIATTAWEIEQIHRLNYQAFVEEIPQHPPNPARRLVDKFHEQNVYVIGCVQEAGQGDRCDGSAERVVAMAALRDQRPFSLDQKLDDLDQYLPPHQHLGEIRLLYIAREYRTAVAFRDLLEAGAKYGIEHGWDLAVISGTTRQARLYRNLGFVPFGPLVGTPGAQFQPMYWTFAAFYERLNWLQALQTPRE